MGPSLPQIAKKNKEAQGHGCPEHDMILRCSICLPHSSHGPEYRGVIGRRVHFEECALACVDFMPFITHSNFGMLGSGSPKAICI